MMMETRRPKQRVEFVRIRKVKVKHGFTKTQFIVDITTSRRKKADMKWYLYVDQGKNYFLVNGSSLSMGRAKFHFASKFRP